MNLIIQICLLGLILPFSKSFEYFEDSSNESNEWCECFELQENPLYEDPKSPFGLFKSFIKVFDGVFTIWA